MVTKAMVSAWRAAVLKQMQEDDLSAEVQEPYKPGNKAAGSSDLAALLLLETRMQEDGFSPLALENLAWYTYYGAILIRVFVQHKGAAVFFTLVAKGSGVNNNIEAAEYMTEPEPNKGGLLIIERRFFDVASLVLPKQG